jgi:hypothetical protein
MTIVRERIPSADPRLGRHIHHDSASRRYSFPTEGLTVQSVVHPRHIPILDQGQVGSCFPPGTRIRLADGSERAIEDVRLGERVVTAEGHTGRVVRSLLRDEDGGLIRLILTGHSHLRMTSEHRVLTSRGYVAANELRVGDEVALPKYSSGESTHVSPAEHVTKASHRLTRGNRWVGLPARVGLSTSAHALPDKIELTERFGRLIGLFLAEGNCDSGKVCWTLNINERDTLGAEIVSIMADYGVEAHTRDLPFHHSHRVTVYGTAWTRLLSSLCGDGAGRKRLHPELAGGTTEFLAAVLSGWLSGDGWTKPDGTQAGITISDDLALGMYDIAQALGHHPVLVHSPPVANNAAKTRQWRWTLSMAPGPGRCRETETYVWRKVRETRLEDYVGPVYDLTVEGDHSYVAEGVGVHNCTAEAGIGALATDPLFGGPTGKYSLTQAGAYALYSDAETLDGDGPWPPNDNGSSGLSVAKVLKAKGLISGYQHTFTLEDALKALSVTPILIGINWYSSMDSPDQDGRIRIGGAIRGGHELVVRQIDAPRQRIWPDNSWGLSFGLGGRCYLTFADFGTLLSQQGDVTVLIPLTSPSPVPTPVPVPTPTPGDPDAALAAIATPWVGRRHSGGNTAMWHATQAWLKAKGL